MKLLVVLAMLPSIALAKQQDDWTIGMLERMNTRCVAVIAPRFDSKFFPNKICKCVVKVTTSIYTTDDVVKMPPESLKLMFERTISLCADLEAEKVGM